MSRQSNDEYAALTVRIHAVTAKAVLISEPEASDAEAVWIPRSQCRFDSTPMRDEVADIEVKEWVAKREGLVL